MKWLRARPTMNRVPDDAPTDASDSAPVAALTGLLLSCDLPAPGLLGLDCVLGPADGRGGPTWPVHLWVRLAGDPFDALFHLTDVQERLTSDASVTVTADKVVIGAAGASRGLDGPTPLTFSRV